MKTETKKLAKMFVAGINEALTVHNTNGQLLRALLDSVEQDIEAAAAAVAEEWETSGFDRSPTREIVSACYEADLSKEEMDVFVTSLRKMGKVKTTRQRQNQLKQVIYDKNVKANNGNNGNKTETGAKSKTDAKSPVKPVLTVADIIAAVKALPSLTAADASALATAIKAKLA